MLQKQSKSNAKWKYLFLLPLIAGILTYVGCTDDSGLAENDTTLSLEEQIADLEATLDAKEEITTEERALVGKLLDKANQKSLPPAPPKKPDNIALDEIAVGERVEIIEVEETESQKEYEDVPFAVVDEVPTFPGCESLSGNEEKKMCMSQQVSQIVNRNFNTALGKELGLTGINRIYVRFKIDKNGRVTDVASRASHPKLEEEAIRVVSMLPNMTPGKQRGEAVNVLYSLPIVFQTN